MRYYANMSLKHKCGRNFKKRNSKLCRKKNKKILPVLSQFVERKTSTLRGSLSKLMRQTT